MSKSLAQTLHKRYSNGQNHGKGLGRPVLGEWRVGLHPPAPPPVRWLSRAGHRKRRRAPSAQSPRAPLLGVRTAERQRVQKPTTRPVTQTHADIQSCPGTRQPTQMSGRQGGQANSGVFNAGAARPRARARSQRGGADTEAHALRESISFHVHNRPS